MSTTNPNTDSILNSIKKSVGVDPSYTPFDDELIMDINTCFMNLNQIGVDSFPTPFYITDSSKTWDDYLNGDTRIQGVKTYVSIKVRLMFDAPSGAVKEALENVLKETEYRLYQEKDYVERV